MPARRRGEAGACRRCASGERLARGAVDARPAFHPAAAALQRGEPGQEAGGARHRPALDLRLDHPGTAGPRLCPPRQAPLHAGGPRPAGHRLPDQLLRALRRIQLHRRSGGPARRRLRRADRLEGRAARVLARFLRRGRRHQRPDDQGGARGARRRARPALLPRDGTGGRDPRLCPACAAGRLAEARQVRRLYRLLELSRMPLHPRRSAVERRGRRRAEPAAPKRARQRSGDRPDGQPSRRAPTAITSSSARRRTARQAEARLAAARTEAGRCRSGDGAGRCWRCRARSGAHPETASRSSPGSAASAPISSTARLHLACRPTTTY